VNCAFDQVMEWVDALPWVSLPPVWGELHLFGREPLRLDAYIREKSPPVVRVRDSFELAEVPVAAIAVPQSDPWKCRLISWRLHHLWYFERVMGSIELILRAS